MRVRRVVRVLGVILSFVGVLVASGCGNGADTTFSPRITAPEANVPFSATDTVVGSGATTGTGDLIFVSYTGWIYDPNKPDNKGRQFDSAESFGFILGIGSVIKGWDNGIPGMKVGGTRVLVIPPDQAYGSTPNGSIRPNSTLLFEVKLLSTS
jgi:FKBP-type peptidyl-prolyl cis-trans isomerase FkpA